LLEQIAVDGRMARHEWRSETGRESRLWFGDASLVACTLWGVARKEMVHRLVGRELRNWRENAESICRQHHDILRHWAKIVCRRVRNEVDRICPAAILSERRIVQIELARNQIDDDIFEHCAEALGGRVDLRL